MRRWLSGFLTALLPLLLAVPSAVAVGGPTVSLSLDRTVVPEGESAVLTVSITGAADLYGSSIDIYYDSNAVIPVLPGPDVTTATTAIGKVTEGLTPSGYFIDYPFASGRQSLVAVRVGTQPGAGGNGALGSIEFRAADNAAGHSFTFDLASNVVVKLVSATGVPITPATLGAPATLSVGSAAPLSITGPSGVVRSTSVTVAGTAPAGALVTVGIFADGVEGPSVVTPVTVQATLEGVFSATFPHLPDGSYIAVAAAGDDEVPGGRFYVDNADPIVTMAPVTTPVSPLPLHVDVTEANLDKVYVQVNPTTSEPTAEDEIDPLGTNDFTWYVNLRSGSNHIRVTAVDKAGNAGTATLDVAYTMPVLKLTAERSKVAPGDPFTVLGVIDNLPANLHGLVAEMEYDHTLLQLNAANPVDFVGSVLESDYKIVDTTTPGKIRLSITNPNGPNPDLDIAFRLQFVAADLPEGVLSRQAAITFTPLSAPDTTGGDGVRFDDHQPEVIPNGSAPAFTIDILNGGSLSGNVDLRERSNDSGATVKAYKGGVVVATRSTDADGEFTFDLLPPGTYELVIQHGSYLATRVTGVPVTSATSTYLYHMGLELLPGNIRDNSVSTDTVFLEDLGAMARAWGTHQPQGLQHAAFVPSWDPRADLDGNGGVYLSDLGILATYWGKGGGLTANPAAGTVRAYEEPVYQD